MLDQFSRFNHFAFRPMVLPAILLLGLILRIYGLGDESIWFDEGYSIRIVRFNFLPMLMEVHDLEPHPPLYHIILHAWILIFGDSEISARFPSVIFGCFSIYIIYKIGTLIFNTQVGIFSSLLLATSLFHITYSQEARMYTLLALLTLLSNYYFLRLLRQQNSLASLGFIFSSALLLYTHIYGAFIIIAQNLYFLSMFVLSKDSHKLSFKTWFILQTILAVLIAPWVGISLIKRIMMVQENFWISTPSIETLVESFVTYSGSYRELFLYLLLFVFSLFSLEKIRGTINWTELFGSIQNYSWKISFQNIDKTYFLFLWLLTPIILPFVISNFSQPIYQVRYTIGASLPFYILAAKGITTISQNIAIKSMIIILIIVGSLQNIWHYYDKVEKPQWREATTYVNERAKPGDVILLNSIYEQFLFDYYSKRTDLMSHGLSWDGDEKRNSELESLKSSYERIWLITPPWYSDGSTQKSLSESFSLSFSFTANQYREIRLFLFER